ncbi:MAG: hypothetical protein Q4C98_04890 [Capnocytophaga sp.]|nr:hypothetical protein [Capnocytophaga sp.]
MKNLFRYSFWIAVLLLGISCSKEAPAPENEKEDLGHELPSRVEVISTEMVQQGNDFIRTSSTQKQVYTVNGVSGLISSGDTFQWKRNVRYLLEIVYYNSNNQRMNNEFVDAQMAPIHQHFFRVEGKTTAQMDEILTYSYQDTNPETGYLGEANVTLLKRSWDKNQPDGLDPIGLKGVFYAQGEAQQLKLRITLAHFLGAERGFNKLQNGQVRKYNELPSASFFASDFDVSLPVTIVE